MKNIIKTVIESGNFKTLVKAAQETGLLDTLSSEGPFTVFAPTDEAFSKIPARKLENLLNDKDELMKILTYHVLADRIMSNEVVNLNATKTVNGKDIIIEIKKGVQINKANVIKTDIECSNGVIHIIDKVLIPN